MSRSALIQATILCLLLAACSKIEPTPTITPTELPTITPYPSATATPTLAPPTATITATPPPTRTPTPNYPPEGYGPENFPANINPLTGLPVLDPGLLNRRPIAVKINITPRNRERPPWGISLAEIVYEFYHNDGYPRFHAIFYSQDAELAGSIRSGRLLDDSLIRMYKSIFVYGGADPKIDYFFYSSPYYDRLVREGSTFTCPPNSEHPLCRFDPNGLAILLADTSAVRESAIEKGVNNSQQNLNGMFFQLNPPVNGTPCKQITARYSGDSYHRWTYDASSGRYQREQDTVLDQGQGEDYGQLVDQLLNTQVAADNVVTLLVPHSYYQPPPSEIIEILLNGTGKAIACRDGQMFETRWNRPTSDSVLFLTFPDGNRYPFKPGNTWFEVVGETTKITQPDAESWRFDFSLP